MEIIVRRCGVTFANSTIVLFQTDEPDGIKQGKQNYDYTKSDRLQENSR